jgi:TPR repeat protein
MSFKKLLESTDTQSIHIELASADSHSPKPISVLIEKRIQISVWWGPPPFDVSNCIGFLGPDNRVRLTRIKRGFLFSTFALAISDTGTTTRYIVKNSAGDFLEAAVLQLPKSYSEALARMNENRDQSHSQQLTTEPPPEPCGFIKMPIEELKAYAEGGNPYAQIQLALRYESGTSEIAKDQLEALKWFHKAADQGLPEAQYSLGVRYRYGEDLAKDMPKNHAEGAGWLHKAAENGHVGAQSTLGACYYYGEGVTRDPDAAIRWWRAAAAQGDESAQNNLRVAFGL